MDKWYNMSDIFIPDKLVAAGFTPSQLLASKIHTKNLVVAVVGLGYVGVPLILTMARHGIKTIGFDISPKKVASFNKAEAFLKDMNIDQLKIYRQNDFTRATSSASELIDADIIILCVPTPLTRNLDPDMSYIENASKMVASILRKGMMVVLESTTFPGTTTDVMTPILETSGLNIGQDFFVAYSPEREDPGNKQFHTASTPKIVGADDEVTRKLACDFYDIFIEQTVPVSSAKIAESAKLMENIFRSVNIGLVNELKTVFTEMGIDIWEVIDAAKTKPFGFMPFYPGPGIGGHCIPIDPLYLTWKSNEYKIGTRFIRLATEINQSMPRYVMSGLAEALNDRFAKSLKGANILIVGLAYKKNVDDARESPSADLVALLKKRGSHLSYYDPFVNADTLYEYDNMTQVIGITQDNLAKADAVVIMTDHDMIDWEFLVTHARLVIDTRNATKNVRIFRDKIVKF